MLSMFISYARSDSEFALRLAKDLRSLGTAFWMDQLNLSGGTRWDQAVEEALKSCSALLVILSSASVQSNNVLDEVYFALDRNKRVIPVLYQSCDIPFRLKRLQHIDFSRSYASGLAGLQKTLLSADIIQPRDSSRSFGREISRTPALSSPPRQFVVEGTKGWQGTGMRIDNGDVVKIVYLEGTWRNIHTGERLNPDLLGSDGDDTFDCLPVKSALVAYGGLIARIGKKVSCPSMPSKRTSAAKANYSCGPIVAMNIFLSIVTGASLSRLRFQMDSTTSANDSLTRMRGQCSRKQAHTQLFFQRPHGMADC